MMCVYKTDGQRLHYSHFAHPFADPFADPFARIRPATKTQVCVTQTGADHRILPSPWVTLA